MRMRIALSAGLLAPLAFFVFLVVSFGEAWYLAAAGVLVYAWILAQFFVFQNPAWRARRARQAVPGGEPSAEAGGLAGDGDL